MRLKTRMYGPNEFRSRTVNAIKNALPDITSEHDLNEICISLSIVLAALVTAAQFEPSDSDKRAYDLAIGILEFMQKEVANAER